MMAIIPTNPNNFHATQNLMTMFLRSSEFDVSFNLRRQHKVVLVMKNRGKGETLGEKSDTQLFEKPLHPFIIHLIDVNMSREHFPPLQCSTFWAAEFNPHRDTFRVRCANENFFQILLFVDFPPPTRIVSGPVQYPNGLTNTEHIITVYHNMSDRKKCRGKKRPRQTWYTYTQKLIKS